ncbi:hypothetical protein Dgeo_1022 [Deinococcus geothermalis DSM 11300]|uniref:Uncharacterized protein n=1 Tax=Deinococcus geothermalis (strain DSM 11300 / CIP 105573 / AG-3a) TaxID=319795 RepID=Q1IZL2_DEIGD|nr:hypothetical protein [Deinococcus geothermalis]ABF45322.1 hypothetical protein Dgeo_1022 [Deinococcus geothermalis DSM 11300]
MTEDRLPTLLASEPYWTVRALREQGSRFYRALGEALEAADLTNRRRIYEAWTDEVWEFYERGLRLAAARASGEG